MRFRIRNQPASLSADALLPDPTVLTRAENRPGRRRSRFTRDDAIALGSAFAAIGLLVLQVGLRIGFPF
jgi:hypothetical protein